MVIDNGGSNSNFNYFSIHFESGRKAWHNHSCLGSSVLQSVRRWITWQSGSAQPTTSTCTLSEVMDAVSGAAWSGLESLAKQKLVGVGVPCLGWSPLQKKKQGNRNGDDCSIPWHKSDKWYGCRWGGGPTRIGAVRGGIGL